MGRTIGIVSAKGGVGKTVIAVNLASAMMDFTKHVIALDADVKVSGLSLRISIQTSCGLRILEQQDQNSSMLVRIMEVNPADSRIRITRRSAGEF